MSEKEITSDGRNVQRDLHEGNNTWDEKTREQARKVAEAVTQVCIIKRVPHGTIYAA